MNRRSVTDGLDEVDSLLREAQDEVLLNLTVNSHISRGASHIDPDLNARFQALKSSSPSQPSSSSSAKPQSTAAKVKPKDDDDLFERFAALKSSIQSSSSDSNPKEEKLSRFESGEGEDEEDEVQKLMQWAVDAARLDPSPPSDEDAEEDDESDDDDDDDDDDDEKIARKKKGLKKKKK